MDDRRIAQLHAAETLWEAVCVLLSCWRASVPDEPAIYDDGDARVAWSDQVEAARHHFGEGPPRMGDDFDDADKAFVLALTNQLTLADAVHAVAWGMSDVVHHTFVDSWRDELRGSETTVHELTEGAHYPVPDSPWKPSFAKASAKPASLSPPLIDELPHVRAFRSDQPSTVRIDFRFESSLEAVLTNLRLAGALVPNDRWNEIDFAEDRGLCFPVAPADPISQRGRLEELVGDALDKRLRLAVLPELCVTASDVDALAQAVHDHEFPHLLVAGSHHDIVGDRRENIAVGLLAGHDERMLHRKTVPFTQDVNPTKPPAKEGIRHQTHLELTVFQAGPFRVALPICKELLDQRLTHALDRLGVNVILVGALSAKTEPFGAATAGRIAGTQALVIVVNNPRCGPDDARLEPNIVLGQPHATTPVEWLCIREEAPHLGVLDIGP